MSIAPEKQLGASRDVRFRHVVLGIVKKGTEILTLWRNESQTAGGLWSFPGGKVEAKETSEQALIREFREETGLEIEVVFPLVNFALADPEEKVFIETFEARITADSGFFGGDSLRWKPIDELRDADFPAANRPILNALRLPNYYAVVPIDNKHREEIIERATAAGASLLALRAKHCERARYAREVEKIISCFPQRRKNFLVHDYPELVSPLGVAGAHLSQRALGGAQKRPITKKRWFAVSCHSLAETREARRLDADFCVLGPVRQTPSHAGMMGMGFDNFAAIAGKTAMPVYAIGGMNLADYEMSRRHGGQGIAGIRCFLGKR